MAHDNIEIEIKIHLDEASFLRIKDKLTKIALFDKVSRQVDEYFTPANRNFLEPEFPFEWMSIRNRSGKSILNYKHWYPENAEVTTHCDEIETEVDGIQLKKIFSALNFKHLITVEKQREIYMFQDEFEIGLDTVKDLGFFIEIESIKDFGSVEKTRKKIFEFAEILGIDHSRELRGYPFLLMKKKGLIK